MRSCFFIVLAGVLAAVGAASIDRAAAQDINSRTSADFNNDLPPTIGTTGTTTPPPPPPAPPTPPPLYAPVSSLFSPVVPYGGAVSQTGEALAESLKQSNASAPYNFRVGPVEVRAEADMNVSVNDNIGLTKDNRQTDILFSPLAIMHGRWNVSDLNTLTFNIGVGYEAYLLNSQYDDVIIAPDSEVNFNLFVGDCTINFHDNFSYEQDPTQVGQLSNQVRLSRFANDAGITATWDLNQFLLTAAYDHTNLWVLESAYDYLTNQSDTFSPQLTYKVNETINTGLSASFSDTRYDKTFENDNTNETVGPFVTATLSNFLSVSAAAGGFFTQYDQGGGNGDTNSSLASYYANFGINHRINEFLSESLTGGKSYLPGLTSNYTERIYVNYNVNWQATQQIGLGAGAFWENLSDSGATFSEDSDRYGLNLNLNDRLSDHLNVNVGYQFILKDANPSIESYVQNVGTLGMQYNF